MFLTKRMILFFFWIVLSLQFNGEPHSYTRFNLTQNMEGDNSQVEMKLSSDMDEEVGGNGVGDHLNHNSNRKPYVAQKLGRTPKNLCFMAAATLLIFIIGKRGLWNGKAGFALSLIDKIYGDPQGSLTGMLLLNLYLWLFIRQSTSFPTYLRCNLDE